MLFATNILDPFQIDVFPLCLLRNNWRNRIYNDIHILEVVHFIRNLKSDSQIVLGIIQL